MCVAPIAGAIFVRRPIATAVPAGYVRSTALGRHGGLNMHDVSRATVGDELSKLDLLPEDIIEGTPEFFSKTLYHDSGDKAGGFSGIFSATPGTVKAFQPGVESIYVLSGEARAEGPDGQTAELRPGQLVVLTPGAWIWTFVTEFRGVVVRNAHVL
jgi:uncharacterized cupin superfamily protein